MRKKKNKRNWNVKDWLIASLISLVAVFAPIKAILLVTGVLIVADLITGILAARKRGEKIKSAGLRRTVTKVLVYNSAVMLGFLMEKYMLEGFVPVSKIAAGLISIVEGKSIFENLDVINGSPIFKSLVHKLGSINDTKNIASEIKKQEDSKTDLESK